MLSLVPVYLDQFTQVRITGTLYIYPVLFYYYQFTQALQRTYDFLKNEGHNKHI